MAANPSPYGPMTLLQNRWYNGLLSGLGMSPQTFQILQPAAVIATSDSELWTIQNQVPPFTLTWNSWVYSSSRFFTEYAAVVPQMQFPENTFELDIGASTYQAWQRYLKKMSQPPQQKALPQIFREWALLNAPGVANKGASDLNRMVLIASARDAIRPYQGDNAKPVDFAETVSQLLAVLNQSSPAEFNVDLNTTSADVGDTWTQGLDPCFFGLWTGSWCGRNFNRKFAASLVQVSCRFEHWTILTSTPGAWYNSWLLNLAYSSKTAPPWPDSPKPTWDEIFGPGKGSMQRLIASLLVVDEMSVTVTSDATFDVVDQASIRQNSKSGFWPFYCQSEPSTGAVTNTVTFPHDTLKIQTTTSANHPVIIGANVLDIAHYLGHA